MTRVYALLLEHSIVVVLAILCLGMGLWSDAFLTVGNWSNILNNLAVTGIVALGVALVIIAGGIDLSFGSILACCAMLAAWLQPQNLVLAIVAPLALGGFLGAINGGLVAGVGANPLITTLGTQWLFSAGLMIVTGGQLIQSQPEGAFHLVGNGRLLGLPFPILLLAVAGILTWFLSAKTALGNFIYAHGSNEKGLRFAGVRSVRVYLTAFVVMGILVGLAGVLLASRLGGVRPTAGEDYLIHVLTAVLLSGVSLNGGIGSIFHVLVAVIVLAVIDNAMVLLGVPIPYQQMIKGVIFVLSILYSNQVVRRLTNFQMMGVNHSKSTPAIS